MKIIGRCLLLFCLNASAGCMTDAKEKRPEAPKKTAAAKPAETETPVAISKILPPSQVNEQNAHAQAEQLYETLTKEKGQLEKSETASRDR